LRQRCIKLASQRPGFQDLAGLVEAAQENQRRLCVDLVQAALDSTKRQAQEGAVGGVEDPAKRQTASILTQIVLLLQRIRTDVDAGEA
jgi:hypothetical protein